jgi:sugar O-acyltransferase (sialic acid O-acetyltransferase NeuD family)
MKNLLIIGARGFGREIYNLAIACIGFQKDYVVKGYLDDNKNALDGYNNYPPIVSSVEDYGIQQDDIFICALGDVFYKEKYSRIILDKGGEFATLIHPTAQINSNVVIGRGCAILNYAVIGSDAVIGDFVNIQQFGIVGHDVTIGDWTMIDCHCFCGGFSKVGKSCTMHTSSVLVPKKKIGDNVTVNAGAIVIRNIKDNKTVMGNPAKELLFPKINK